MTKETSSEISFVLQIVVNFQAWRWLFFFAFTMPIYIICRGIMKCLVLLLESNFIDTKQMLYYLIGIKVCQSHRP